MANREFSWLDKLICEIDHGLRGTHQLNRTGRENPAESLDDSNLSAEKQQLSANLMRVNHAGEIAAQALYRGQAFVAKSEAQREHLLAAGQEEEDHLNWCESRLKQLNDKPSLLAPFWYSGSFAIGVVAGLAGDQWSLGFVEETEIQVSEHLDKHLGKLPQDDNCTRAILQQMRIDEAEHAEKAHQAGAKELPSPIKYLMRQVAKVMTGLSYRF